MLLISGFATNLGGKHIYKNKLEKNIPNNVGLKFMPQLDCDTVSFGAVTKKALSSRNAGISRKLAIDIHNENLPLQEKVNLFFEKLFEGLIKNKDNPKGIIEKLEGRCKTPDSIREKCATRAWESKDDVIDNMSDIHGNRAVLSNGKENGYKLAKRILHAVKNEKLKIIEIENKRPGSVEKDKKNRAKYDYIPLADLQKLVAVNKEIHGIKPIHDNDYTKSNYMALHFLLDVPVLIDKKVEYVRTEFQVLGHDVAEFKKLDDLIYKIFNNKNIDSKYAPISEVLESLSIPYEILSKSKNEVNELGENYFNYINCPQKIRNMSKSELKQKIAERKAFDAYRAKVFLSQREKEMHKIVGGDINSQYFEPVKNLSREYDMNNLYSMMLKCENVG